MTNPLPQWPEWMDLPTLAAYIGKKPSAIRTLLKHGAIPRPSRWGNITLWSRQAVDRRLMRGEPDKTPGTMSHEEHQQKAKAIRKSLRKFYLVS